MRPLEEADHSSSNWGKQMQRIAFVSVAPIVIAVVLAACGGSSSSSSSGSSNRTSATASAPSGTTAQGATSRPASSSTSTSSSASVALITTKHDKLGTILAYGSKKLTVYLFEADKGSSSRCTGACASAWPPVTGKPQAGTGAVASDLSTITRPDGSAQVTYKGHPLYLFIKDKDNGDAYGQGVKAFGADWYVLAPSGNKVDNS
jgi:predicted lipoprotein with Yx(FWY)xxD motif